MAGECDDFSDGIKQQIDIGGVMDVSFNDK